MTRHVSNRREDRSRASRRSGQRGRWLLLIGSSLATLVVADFALRVVGYGADRGPYIQEFVGTGIRLTCFDRNLNDYLDVDLTDPAVRRRLYDEYGVMDMEGLYPHTPHGVLSPCDERGMRPGQIRPKAPGKIRVIAIGDSFTYGQGLKPGDPWPAQLEAVLDSEGGSGRFEVLNGGISARQVDTITELCRKEWLGLEPDAVVYAWYLNDPVLSGDFTTIHAEVVRGSHEQMRFVHGRYMSKGWDTVTGLRRLSAIYDLAWCKVNELARDRLLPACYNGMYGEDNAEGWAKSRRLLQSTAEACRTRGSRLHVAIWPMLIDLGASYPFDPAHRAVAEVCREAEIPVLDLRERLRAYRIDTLILHPMDRHPSKRACRIAAVAIRDHLREHHPAWFR